jgi:hypothetical protein
LQVNERCAKYKFEKKSQKGSENYLKGCEDSTKKEKNNIREKYQTLCTKNYYLIAHLILVTTVKIF